MMRAGFDNERYLAEQSAAITERIEACGDKLYLEFGEAFESQFLRQGEKENRTIEQTLDLGWEMLGLLPREELHRLSDAMLAAHYRGFRKDHSAQDETAPVGGGP